MGGEQERRTSGSFGRERGPANWEVLRDVRRMGSEGRPLVTLKKTGFQECAVQRWR